MAHHIAELIAECDTADAADSKAAKERCAAAILELWSHRASLTGTSKPFQDLVPIIETLRALDPDREHLFYRRMIPNIQAAANEKTLEWLTFAKNCDAIARMLIDIAIQKAAGHAGDTALVWAESASQAGLASDLDIQISYFLDQRLNDADRANERQIRQLTSRIEKLETFLAAASALRADFQKQLTDLESPDDLQSNTQE